MQKFGYFQVELRPPLRVEINNKYVDITNVKADQRGRKKGRAIVPGHGTKQEFPYLISDLRLCLQVVLNISKSVAGVNVDIRYGSLLKADVS